MLATNSVDGHLRIPYVIKINMGAHLPKIEDGLEASGEIESAPRETRTPNRLFRRQVLCPIELWAHIPLERNYSPCCKKSVCLALLGVDNVWACRRISPRSALSTRRKPFKISVHSVFSVVSRYVAHSFSHSWKWMIAIDHPTS
jgi:hypothetical protein